MGIQFKSRTRRAAFLKHTVWFCWFFDRGKKLTENACEMTTPIGQRSELCNAILSVNQVSKSRFSRIHVFGNRISGTPCTKIINALQFWIPWIVCQLFDTFADPDLKLNVGMKRNFSKSVSVRSFEMPFWASIKSLKRCRSSFNSHSFIHKVD